MSPIAAFLLALSAPLGDSLTVRYLEPGEPPESDWPVEVEITPDGGYGLILNSTSENLTVYDLAAGETKWALELGGEPADMELSPDGLHLVVAVETADQLAVVSLADHSIESVVATGSEPAALRISPDGSLAYSFCAGDATLVVSSLVTGEILDVAPVAASVADGFRDLLVLTPDGERIIVAGWYGLESFDTATLDSWKSPTMDVKSIQSTPDGAHVILRTTAIGDIPAIKRIDVSNGDTEKWLLPGDEDTISGRWLEVDAQEEFVFVGTRQAVQRLELATGDVIESEPLLYDYLGTLTPSGNVAVSGHSETEPVVQFLDPDTLSLVSEITGIVRGGTDWAFQPSGDEGLLLLYPFGKNLLHFREDGTTSEMLHLVSSGVGVEADQPGGIGFHPNGVDALVTNIASSNLTRLDVASGRVTGHVDLDERRPMTVAYSPDGASAIAITNHDLDGASALVLDPATGAPLAEFPVHSYRTLVAFFGGDRAVLLAPDGLPGGSDFVTFLELRGADTAVLRRFDAPLFGASFGSGSVAEVTGSGRWLVVTSDTTKEVSVLSTERMTVDHQVSLVGSVGLAARPGTDEVAVAMGPGGIRVLAVDNGASQQVGKWTGVSVLGDQLAYSPDGAWLYASGQVAHGDGKIVARFDADTGELVETLPFADDDVTHWTLAPSGDRLFQVLRDWEVKESRLWSVSLTPAFGEPIDILVDSWVEHLESSPAGDVALTTHGIRDVIGMTRVD